MQRKEKAIYMFNKVEKAKVLSGRTITYIAKQIGRQVGYVTNILNGKIPCGIETAKAICHRLCFEAKLEDYFTKIDNKTIWQYLENEKRKK